MNIGIFHGRLRVEWPKSAQKDGCQILICSSPNHHPAPSQHSYLAFLSWNLGKGSLWIKSYTVADATDFKAQAHIGKTIMLNDNPFPPSTHSFSWLDPDALEPSRFF
jgi:hypothetical protein